MRSWRFVQLLISCNFLFQVGQALGISTDWSNHPLYMPGKLKNNHSYHCSICNSYFRMAFMQVLKDINGCCAGGLELLDGPEPEKILIGPRVGIEYALPEHVNALWRFAIADTPWISAPKNTLRPP